MKIVGEFKEFIYRGNVMDMAIGIIIGSAFTAIVTSLTTDIIKPFIKLVTRGEDADVAGLTIPVPGGSAIDFGSFISAVLNFFIVAVIVFALMKFVNKLRKIREKTICELKGEEYVEEKDDEPHVCPWCLEEVKPGARRCPHCTGVIEGAAQKAPSAAKPAAVIEAPAPLES